ncbi:Alkaline phosphatase synthesis transcriptional regulatory protein PhoP [subsurface metagenome]|nr:response regulator [Clostridia bacterium]
MKKILVVDDEKDVLDLVRRVLIRGGFEVITASDGKEGLAKVYSEAPDLMILDINMPVMDGWQVCRKIRGDPLYKHLPIIMLTVRRTKTDQLKGLDIGGDEYITKPFSPTELIARVKTVLQRASGKSS